MMLSNSARENSGSPPKLTFKEPYFILERVGMTISAYDSGMESSS